MKNSKKKTIFSGVKPSGELHIGNYLGAISQWVPMQDEYEAIFCVVDYHAITVKQDPELLRKRTIDIARVYLASGIDPKKAVIFQQSHISAHTELAWIFNTQARMSDLLRMTQFKEKSGIQQGFESLEKGMQNLSKKNLSEVNPLIAHLAKTLSPEDRVKFTNQAGKSVANTILEEYKNLIQKLNKVEVGIFDYPALMAADILLYNTDIVPVGEDQKQHVELARDLAKRFNHNYGEVFRIPVAQVKEEGARIMGLDDPMKKMGKSSSSEAGYIALNESPEKAKKKIMRAVTDSEAEVRYDKEKKPAVSNLLTIYSSLSGKTIKELEKEYKGKGYGDFKKGLAEAVGEFLIGFQKKYNSYSDGDVRSILDAGAKKVRPIAEETLERTKKAMGII